MKTKVYGAFWGRDFEALYWTREEAQAHFRDSGHEENTGWWSVSEIEIEGDHPKPVEHRPPAVTPSGSDCHPQP